MDEDEYEQTEPIVMSKPSDAPVQEVDPGSDDELLEEKPTMTAPRRVNHKPVIVVANPRNERLRRPGRSYEPPNEPDTQAPQDIPNDDLREAQRADYFERKVDEHDKASHEEDIRAAIYAGALIGGTIALAGAYIVYRGWLAPKEVAAAAPKPGVIMDAATQVRKAKPRVQLG